MMMPRTAANHPLELIPFFRQWQPSVVRNLVYTFIWGLLFCLFFFALFAYNMPAGGLVAQLWIDFVIAMVISYTIHGLHALGDVLLGRWLDKLARWLQSVYYTALSTCGVFAGYFLGTVLLNPGAVHLHIFTPGVVLSFAIVAVLVSCALLFAYLVREREIRGKERLDEEQRRALESERRALEAQLRMLQAQIEPHFLYNTLANAVGLIQPAPDRARLLLERLIDYLRATLVASRGSDTPLQREIDAITAYLELMKLRMGERLRYRIELPEAAAHLPLPPMLLQPVVENAISHGLEPKIEGGEIVLAVQAGAGHLHIRISDTGVGLRPDAPRKAGGGVGLSNLRQRIAALYGKEGSLSVTGNAGGGVSVALRIPLPPVPCIESGETCTPH